MSRIWMWPRRGLTVLSCGLLAMGMLAWLLPSQEAAVAASQKRLIPIYCVETEEKKASLTFDAAWGNEDTQQLIDVLGSYGVKATFFVVGDWAERYPESVMALYEAGHEIQSHSDSHPHMSALTREQMARELEMCAEKIKAVTGVRPTLFRPPYGEYNNTLLEVCWQEGYQCIQWDVDSLDWKGLSAGEITQRVLGKVGNGSVILFHNAAEHTPQALPMLIDQLQQQGYELVPVSQLIYPNTHETDHTGRQLRPNP